MVSLAKHRTVQEDFKLKAEWFLIYEDGREKALGPNAIVDLDFVGASIAGMATPYLVVGDDEDAGNTITEVFRKAVSNVIQSGGLIRFRTQLLGNEGNGDHKKLSIFRGATGVTGSGAMFNLLRINWSKAAGVILTVECRITIQEVTA